MSLLKKAVLLAFLLTPIFVCAQNIRASDANEHLGEQETVCGRVAEVKITTSVRGTPTFIDFERPYPNETFTAVIWERDKRVLELFQEPAYFASEGRSLSIMDGLKSSFIAVPIGQERKQYLAITGTIRTLTGRPFIHPHILSVGFQRVRLLNVRMGRIASVSIGRGLVRIMGEWRSGFKPTFLGLRTQMQTGSKIEIRSRTFANSESMSLGKIRDSMMKAASLGIFPVTSAKA